MPVRHPILNRMGLLGLGKVGTKMIDALIDASVDTIVKEQGESQAQELKEQFQRQQLEERAKRENIPIVYVSKEQYRQLAPAMFHEQEEKYHCILIPVERDEMDRLRQEAVVYTPVPEMPKVPEVIWQEPSPYFGGASIGKGYKHIGGRQAPKDYAKKKKAKRRLQKQSRRKR